MSVEEDANRIEARMDQIDAAIGQENAPPKITSYDGSSSFQMLVQRMRDVQINNAAPITPQTGAGPADAGAQQVAAPFAEATGYGHTPIVDDNIGTAHITVPPGSIDAMIALAAQANHVDPDLIRAVAKNESGFNPRALSPVGAKGEMQLMDGTAAALGVTDPFDPAQNIAGGAKYLSQLLAEFHGDIRQAVAAYNAGPGAVEKYGGVPPYTETQQYVNNVLASYEAYRARSAAAGSLR